MLAGHAGLEAGTFFHQKSRHLSCTGLKILIGLEILLSAPTPEVAAYFAKSISFYFQNLLYVRAAELMTSVTALYR